MKGCGRLKKRLLHRKRQLETKLKSDMETASEWGSVSDIASGELSSYDNHPAESATQLYEREKDLAFQKMERSELRDIDDALKKMDNGTYGYDEQTGEKIPRARLEALPAARTTVSHSPAMHSRRVRPVEESLIHDLEREGYPAFEDSDFDEQNALDLVSQYNDQQGIFENASYRGDDENAPGIVEDLEGFSATDIGGLSGDDDVQVIRNRYLNRWMARNEDEFPDPLEQ